MIEAGILFAAIVLMAAESIGYMARAHVWGKVLLWLNTAVTVLFLLVLVALSIRNNF